MGPGSCAPAMTQDSAWWGLVRWQQTGPSGCPARPGLTKLVPTWRELEPSWDTHQDACPGQGRSRQQVGPGLFRLAGTGRAAETWTLQPGGYAAGRGLCPSPPPPPKTPPRVTSAVHSPRTHAHPRAGQDGATTATRALQPFIRTRTQEHVMPGDTVQGDTAGLATARPATVLGPPPPERHTGWGRPRAAKAAIRARGRLLPQSPRESSWPLPAGKQAPSPALWGGRSTVITRWACPWGSAARRDTGWGP